MTVNPFELRQESGLESPTTPHTHVYGNRVVCITDERGQEVSPLEIVVDASAGFIPLWAEGTTLNWRFLRQSFAIFLNPEAAMDVIRGWLGEAMSAWGDAAPVALEERESIWDFQVVMRANDDCDASGCVLASAFFPDAGQHKLTIYPKMLEQSPEERIQTLVHELGHTFGLRHYFAPTHESDWPSEIFGEHKPFSIMNYGAQSVLTEADRDDLKKLYRGIWNGDIKNINGTPVIQQKPFHMQSLASGDCD